MGFVQNVSIVPKFVADFGTFKFQRAKSFGQRAKLGRQGGNFALLAPRTILLGPANLG